MSSDKNCFLTGETCRINRIGQRERKKTEEFGRQLREILVKKGYQEGGGSLQRAYRELIGSLYESWTIGIERVYKLLIDSIIQQCQKCQKRSFETKEREKAIGLRPQALGGSMTEKAEGIIRKLANQKISKWGSVRSLAIGTRGKV